MDSTNTNFYTTTMSTQVLRIVKTALFGSDEEVPDKPQYASGEDELPEDEPIDKSEVAATSL